MRVIVAGPRDYRDRDHVWSVLTRDLRENDELVCGMAPGVDSLAYQYAIEHHMVTHLFPADWQTHQRAGGPIRNRQMAWYADVLLAFVRDPVTPGTADMIRQMQLIGKPVKTVPVRQTVLNCD